MEKEFDRTTTEGAARYFQNCIRIGDLDGAMSCFDEEAIYVTEPGNFVRGKQLIRIAIEKFCAMKPDLQAQRAAGFEIGEIASWVDEWSMKASFLDGTTIEMKGISSDILKKQADGNWAYLVDNPYGAEYLNI